MAETLFSSWQLGGALLRNRTVVAPMTRSRCPGNVPGEKGYTDYPV
jgi:2,4-dienoyl-CoA reductase-like NADH-dependent reductase (Old Yellow Enzyme family)